MGIFDSIKCEIDERDSCEGINPADLLDLPPELRRLINRITREGEMSLQDAADFAEQPVDQVRCILDTMAEKGYLEREAQGSIWIYRVRFARKRGRQLPTGIWSALGERTKPK